MPGVLACTGAPGVRVARGARVAPGTPGARVVPGAALAESEGDAEVAEITPSGAEVAARAWCGPPNASTGIVPAAAAAASTASATPNATRGRRWTRRHRCGPRPGDLGKPVPRNAPARYATPVRYARPTGVSSVQAASTRSRSPAGRGASSGTSEPSRSGARRRHSLLATARSHGPSLA